ncbi:hypothetical protein C5167_040829 [Papaver somniferum]|uniref:WRC domain-containing protein n=1 Tax=Papaver somniferum TaxID=3469 RepID=A0A4Y7IG43_PAPSO|nr:hypothetical protein C5167_040829 [Papaver somniferum]
MEIEIHQAGAGGGEQKICRRHNGKVRRCKNVSADNNLKYCDKHFTDFSTKNPSSMTSNKRKYITKKNKEEMEMELLPDEHFCSHTAGIYTSGVYRCKNVRMSYGAATDDASVPKTKYCCSTATGPIQETNCSKRGEKVTGEDDEAEIQKLRAAGDNTSDRIGRKRENVERAEKSGQPESFKGIGETVVELESLEHYKSKCFQLSVELEKKKVECTTLQGKLLGVVETRKTFEDAAEYWRKMYSGLESRVLRVENENSTMRCFFSNLEGILPRHGKESSILRCEELRNSEEIESEAWGLQNEVTQSGEKHNTSNHNAETSSGGRKDSHVFELKTKENVLNVHGIDNNEHHESESEFHYYSAVNISSGSLHLSNGVEKVEEGKGWGCSEERPSQHGSSSQNHLEMSTKAFVNLVSDDDSGECLEESDDSDNSTDSEGSLGTFMDMMAMKYRNRKEDKEIKWKIETDMLSSFEEDPELCLKAVCALYRQQICEDEISDKGLFHNGDALRCTTLAKFLTGPDCKGDLNKSVKELKIFDSNVVEDCKRLARRYSMQLFSIYKNGKDPFFPSFYNCQPWR